MHDAHEYTCTLLINVVVSLVTFIQLVQDMLATQAACSSKSQETMVSEETESEVVPVSEQQQLPQENHSVGIQVTPHRRNAPTQASPKITSICTYL